MASGTMKATTVRQRYHTAIASSQLTTLIRIMVLGLFGAALFMRLRMLGTPFDLDSYDEGVYWQSLMAMSNGQALYKDIFYSQPPFFLLSIYPFFALFGQTIWAARLGVAVISLCGFLGILLLGKVLAGRPGMIVGLILLLINPFYLSESQILQAEMPSVALSMLATGLAYLWWTHPTGRKGIVLAMLTTVVMACSILAKLLTVSVLVPVGLLALAHLWRTTRQPAETRLIALLPLIAGVAAFIVTTALLIIPFSGSFAQFWHTVVTFHTDAKGLSLGQPLGTRAFLRETLNPFSPGNTSLGNPRSILLPFTAFLGTLLALWRRDWRVLPLLAWLLTTLILLRQQSPLFPHHLIALVPPFLGLTVIGLNTNFDRSIHLPKAFSGSVRYIPTALILLSTVVILIANTRSIRHYYRILQSRADSSIVRLDYTVAGDLQHQIKPGQLVITDSQFIAGLAYANTPPALVDTSSARVLTGYVTTEQLIQEASKPETQVILFYTNRLIELPDFHQWVQHHYRLAYLYGEGKEMWVKN